MSLEEKIANWPTTYNQRKEAWLCLLCLSNRKGYHGLLGDRKTPCPYGSKP